MQDLTNKPIDNKITKAQERLLEVLANPENARKTNEEKAKIAGISYKTYYTALRSPNFIQALRIRGLSENMAMTLPVLRALHKNALEGSFMAQRETLLMSQLTGQSPLLQQVININNNTKPEEETDRDIMAKILGKSIQDVGASVTQIIEDSV